MVHARLAKIFVRSWGLGVQRENDVLGTHGTGWVDCLLSLRGRLRLIYSTRPTINYIIC